MSPDTFHQPTRTVSTIPQGIWKVLLCSVVLQPVPLTYAAPSPSSNHRLDADIPWQQCALGYQKAHTAVSPARTNTDEAIHIAADSAEATGAEQQHIVKLSGQVEITQASDTLIAGQVSLNRTTGETLANNNVFLQRADLRLQTQQVNYNLKTKTGTAGAGEYRLTHIPARGTAQQSQLLDNQRSQFNDTRYTTCPPGSNAWHIAAGELTLNPNEGVGTAYHATLSVGDVPVGYLPMMTFPIDDRRRSGVLVPTVGYSKTNGYDVTIPYYFNLAPHYDLTLSPRIMSERGALLGAEFRYLNGNSQGTLEVDYLHQDNVHSTYDQRGSFALKTNSRFTTNLSGSIDVQYVSDNDYLEDLGGDLALSSTTLLKRFAALRYNDATWNMTGQVKHYQSLSSSKPYSLLPQVIANATLPDANSPLTYHFNSELSHFHKADNTSVEGTRINLQPSVSYPVEEDFYHLRPRLGAQYTAYHLDKQSGPDNSPSRLLPTFSLDSGLYFERDTDLLGTATVQTLEPRLFYLFVPEKPQDDLPRFDVGQHSFSTISHLFRENRFSSPDRVGDANQLTLALTTRFNDANNGREYLNASIGQIRYFRDREVTLSGTPETADTSAIIGELNTEFGGGWRGRANVEWNPHNSHVEKSFAQLSYRDTNDRILNMAYRLNEGVSTHTDIAAIWPLTHKMKLIGRWHYSLNENRTLEGLAGIEYGSCCWGVRALTRFYDDNDDDKVEPSFFLQFELKGLGKLGNKIESLLAKGIYGFRKEDD